MFWELDVFSFKISERQGFYKLGILGSSRRTGKRAEYTLPDLQMQILRLTKSLGTFSM